MIVVFWLILRLFFFTAALALIVLLLRSTRRNDSFHILMSGLKTALRDCGFLFSRKNYSLELYKWVIHENEEVCEESLERATWPAMDIADWMKEGLPQDAEGRSICGKNCSCKLVLYKREKIARQSNNQV